MHTTRFCDRLIISLAKFFLYMASNTRITSARCLSLLTTMILIMAVSLPSLVVRARYRCSTSLRTRPMSSFSDSLIRFSSSTSMTAVLNLSPLSSASMHFSKLLLYRWSLKASLILTMSLLDRPIKLSMRSSLRELFDWYQKLAQCASLSHLPRATV